MLFSLRSPLIPHASSAREQEGAIAIAKGLAGNTTLLQLDLMGMPKLGMSERVLTAFIDMYATNFHLKKITWRLDHRLANTLARLVTRNNSIHRRIDQGKTFDDLLPDALRGTGVVVKGVAVLLHLAHEGREELNELGHGLVDVALLVGLEAREFRAEVDELEAHARELQLRLLLAAVERAVRVTEAPPELRLLLRRPLHENFLPVLRPIVLRRLFLPLELAPRVDFCVRAPPTRP